MGQYYKLVNEDKKELVDPWKIGGVTKFLEWLYNDQARLLVWLLRKSNEVGGADVYDAARFQTLGRWAGDRVTLIGDYDESKLYETATEGYTDISELLRGEYDRFCEEDGSDAFKLPDYGNEMGLG